MEYHKPVLLKDCIEALNIKPEGIYVDATFGGGGHSREILKHIGSGKLYAFDQDEDALRNTINDERFTLINQNFKFMKNYLRMYGALPIDGLLADLGVSSHQFDVPDRGFSTRFDGKLDMRMNRKSGADAAAVVNTYTEEKLRTVFRSYGEIENAGKLARALVLARASKKIETTDELKKIALSFARRGKENQYYAQVFQALRIEVNNELEALEQLLLQSAGVLKAGGRLVVLSYHSLEDRLVKNFMRAGKFEGEVEKDFFGNPLSPFKLITKKAIVAPEEEVRENNRARSAKLRVAERN